MDDPYDGLDQDSRKVFSLALDQIIDDSSQQILMVSSHPSDIPTGIDHILAVNDLQVTSHGSRQPVAIGETDHGQSQNRTIELDSFRPGAVFQKCIQEYSDAYAKTQLTIQPPLIQMEHVSVKYGDVEVLKDISWTVDPGQRWASARP